MRFFVVFRMQGDFPSGQDNEAFELPEDEWDELKRVIAFKREQCKNCAHIESREKKDYDLCPFPESNITTIGCRAFKQKVEGK